MAKKHKVIRYLIPVLVVQLRTDDTALRHSYYSGYPFETWTGPSLF